MITDLLYGTALLYQQLFKRHTLSFMSHISYTCSTHTKCLTILEMV